MRVLLFPLGSAGDVHPFVAIGRRLRDRGHDVRLFTNGHFAATVVEAGLRFVESDPADEYHTLANNPDLWHPLRAFRAIFGHDRMGEAVRRHYRLVAEHHVPGETVVAGGTLALGPRVAHDNLGVPYVMVHLQPAVFKSIERTATYAGGGMKPWWPGWAKRLAFWAAGRYFVDPIITPYLNPFRADLGLPPARNIITDWINATDRVIGLFPDWFAPPASDWPANVRLTGFPLYDRGDVEPLAPSVQEFLDTGPPPVVVTFGSAMKFAGPYFAAAAEALAVTGQRAIFLTPHAEQVPVTLPPGVVRFDYVPFGHVFRRAAAVVHHGGIGTTAQALAAGVPQLIVPFAHDQPDNAVRVAALGAGRWIWPSKCTSRRMAEALRALQVDTVRRSCEAVAQRFVGADPLEETCDLIEAASANRPAGRRARSGGAAGPTA
ncbi:MAG TPA: nucleotide disphospho-sugar-binding domain-containing protein [Gemmataceae bacterium]|jgi:rhamnosyltransferase subunit B|nr:nucleotide disphospho-sugar-binding domain-containing protein [Gemmataceae bacterium]